MKNKEKLHTKINQFLVLKLFENEKMLRKEYTDEEILNYQFNVFKITKDAFNLQEIL